MQKTLLFIITFMVATFAGHFAWAGSGPALFTGSYIMGSTVYTARDFAADIAEHVGQPTTAAVVDSIRNAIRGRYAHDGYVAPIISTPPQDLLSSNPRLVIHEALIGGVEIRGNAGPYRSRIEQMTSELQNHPPLRKDQVRSVLTRISQLPGITSRPLFDQRPDATNEFSLILTIEYHPVAGRAEVSNGGTRGLGRELLTVGLTENNLLGIEEQLRLNGAVSSRPDRYHYEDAQLMRRFDNTSVFADISGTTAVPDPDSHFSDVHLSAGVAQNLQLTTTRQLSFGASLNADNGIVRNSSGVTSIEDDERNLAMGVTFSHLETASPGRLYLGAQRGLDFAGSRIDEGPGSDVNGRYTKFLLQAEQVFDFGKSWSVQFDLDGQVTTAILPMLQRFTFGGIGFGAAFDPATLSGDSGAEITAQLARTIRIRDWSLQYLRVYVRSDTGLTWNNSSYFYHRDEATSAGGGVMARWMHVMAVVELSTPVDQPRYVAEAQSIRTFGSIAYVF